MALPVQHTRTQKKHFPCLKFGARISELPSKYRKASSITSEFTVRICAASAINNYCVHVNYHCLHKQLALVCIPRASKQLIVTLTCRILLGYCSLDVQHHFFKCIVQQKCNKLICQKVTGNLSPFVHSL